MGLEGEAGEPAPLDVGNPDVGAHALVDGDGGPAAIGSAGQVHEGACGRRKRPLPALGVQGDEVVGGHLVCSREVGERARLREGELGRTGEPVHGHAVEERDGFAPGLPASGIQSNGHQPAFAREHELPGGRIAPEGCPAHDPARIGRFPERNDGEVRMLEPAGREHGEDHGAATGQDLRPEMRQLARLRVRLCERNGRTAVR